MVFVDGVEPSSLDYKSSALPLSYTKIWLPQRGREARIFRLGADALIKLHGMVLPLGLEPRLIGA